jgi:hypothetical protein
VRALHPKRLVLYMVVVISRVKGRMELEKDVDRMTGNLGSNSLECCHIGAPCPHRPKSTAQ